MFEIYIMVSGIHDNVDLVLGLENFVELEGEISMKKLTFKFLNRPVHIFSVHKEMIKPKEWRYVNAEAPFLDVISDLGIIKLLVLDMYDILTMKVKFQRNKAFLGNKWLFLSHIFRFTESCSDSIY